MYLTNLEDSGDGRTSQLHLLQLLDAQKTLTHRLDAHHSSWASEVQDGSSLLERVLECSMGTLLVNSSPAGNRQPCPTFKINGGQEVWRRRQGKSELDGDLPSMLEL